jgi:putative membrane-bound dehydrogenase-like protein
MTIKYYLLATCGFLAFGSSCVLPAHAQSGSSAQTQAVLSDEVPAPLSPEKSMATMQLSERLTVELVAAEPMVQDPVAMCWDASGAMYVAEMGDYPAEMEGGRIRKLEDLDRDGKMDRATLFVAKVAYPTSVLPYQDGVLVAAAPDILYFRDGNGDGVAEQRTVIISGFGQGNQQLRVNGLIWGLDGWVYGANGRSDGEIGFVNESGVAISTPISIRNRDFRFHPSYQQIETTGGFTQFGQSFDDFGNRFISWNTIPIRHVVMEQRYLSRNAKAPITATTAELSVEGSTPRVFPISRTTKRFNAEPPGYFNASCGLSIYRGNALPIDFRGNAFACEPLSNLVHRDVLDGTGTTFTARRAADELDREFLAATDPWFRPVNTATGPDGALYIADFYRPWVEHPQWVADERARKSVDFSVGKEYGRIYRVVAKGNTHNKTDGSHDLTLMSDDQLLELLKWPNAWQRETAQRLLVARGTVDLTQVQVRARDGKSDLERLHAYAVLYGLRSKSGASSRWLSSMLDDTCAAVRKMGLQWCHDVLGDSTEHDDACFNKALGLVEDEDPAVRFQAICALGDFAAKPIVPSLAFVFNKYGSDTWVRQAIFSGLGDRAPQFIREVAKLCEKPDALDHTRLQWLLLIVASTDTEQQPKFEALYDSLDARQDFWQPLIALGLARRHGAAWVTEFANKNGVFRQRLARLVEDASAAKPLSERLMALGMMEFYDQAAFQTVLAESLAFDQPLLLQQWAVRSAAGLKSDSRAALLIDTLSKASPNIRRAIVDSLITRQELASKLAASIITGKVQWTELDSLQHQLLLSRLNADERQKLEELVAARTAIDRNQLLSTYVNAYADKLDRELGKKMFVQHCQTCHAVGQTGHRVGPDLTAVAGRLPSDIIVDVLDPNRSVAADGFGYAILTKEDEVLSGLIAGETATSVTLKRAGGELVSVLRDDIQELRHLGKSLMPEGFERSLTPHELASLVAYLKSN